jgi:hypothetical protein
MAREASPEVSRARCLPLLGPDGHAQRGWVTIVIVPYSEDSQPLPSVEVRSRVQEYLAAHAPATLARRVRVEGPRYALVSIAAELVPLPTQSAAVLEDRVRRNLNEFLHPLRGGPARQGWEFGETVHLSQIARVLEATEGLDFARNITLSVEGRIVAESIPVDDHQLIAPGDHELKLVLGAD